MLPSTMRVLRKAGGEARLARVGEVELRDVRAQGVHKRLRVAVNAAVEERVLQGERAARAQHAQRFEDERLLVRLRAHFVKDEVARHSVERAVHEGQLRRVALGGRRRGRQTPSGAGVVLAELLAVLPAPAPGVDAGDEGVGVRLGQFHGQRPAAAADVQRAGRGRPSRP